MTHIKYQQQNTPKGAAVINTEHLLIGTDGRVFVRDSSDGRLCPLTDEQVSEIGKHFGVLLGDARLAMRSLS